MQKSLNHDTKISIALMLVLLTAAVTFGIMRQKVEEQGEDITEIKADIKTISYQVQGIEELKTLLRDKYAKIACELNKGEL